MNRTHVCNSQTKQRHFTKELKGRKTIKDQLVVTFLSVLAVIFFIIFAFPVAEVIISSVAVRDTTAKGGLRFSFIGYLKIFENNLVLRGLGNSIMYTTVGTLVSVVITVLSAYALSRPDFRTVEFVTFLFVITNYFNGGFIPTYLLVKKLGMLNSMWSLILPSAISVYNLFLLKSYFRNRIPAELYDAARIDGCGHWRCLYHIILPFSMSYIGIISFFFAVSYWNAYFNASIYITDMDRLPLTNILRELLIKNRDSLALQNNAVTDGGISLIQQVRLMEYALIVTASAPMIFLLMCIRKVFKNQDLMGGVKM